MGDSKKMVECVVVFDEIGLATGEFVEQGPGMRPLAITTSAFRSDKVMLSEEDAKRHLDAGAVILASDKRAKLIKPNTDRAGGVSRDAGISVGAVELEQAAPAVAGEPGVTRTADGKLGTKAELSKLNVTQLKKLAADHGVEVERGDTKPTLAAKLAKVKVDDTAAAEAEPNPGQEPDESPPPDTQPEDSPAESE